MNGIYIWKMIKRRQILLMMAHYVPRIHKGVVDYARDAGWILNASMATNGRIPQYWHGDGVLAITAHGRHDIADTIRKLNVPAVDMAETNLLNLPNVCSDHEGIGRMAAHFLIGKGFWNVYLMGYNKLRNEGFIDEMELHGRTVNPLTHEQVSDVLPNAPKPCVVMCMGDGTAICLLHMLGDLGIDVPGEIAVMGTGNRPLINELAPIPLTSVDNNQELRGFRAAKLLDRLLDGQPPPDEPILIPPKGVAERQSTGIIAVPHPAVAEALKIMREGWSPELTPELLATRCHISRRALDTAFVKHLSQTIDGELRRRRMDRAKSLLENTNDKMAFVAYDSGFTSPEHMYQTFVRELGVSPKAYREREIRTYAPPAPRI